MSLITLSSTANLKPYLYSSHFPQPIRIPAGSQVCCLKMIHYRDENEYLVNNLTDTLYFIIGNKQNDGKRKVVLNHGSYTATDLATEIARAMNAQLQQQNYEFSCSYALTDIFTISIASLPTPSATGGIWNDYIGSNSIYETRSNDGVGQKTLVIPKLIGSGNNPTQATSFLEKGILTHLGTYESQAIPVKYELDAFGGGDIPLAFPTLTLGIVRDVLSLPFPQNPNPNSAFNSDVQDIKIELDGDTDVAISSLNQTSNTAPGNPNYVNNRLMRIIPFSVFENLGQLTITDKTQMVNAMFKFVVTFVSGVTNKAICQMLVSTDRGSTYTEATTTTNDPSGNPYFRSFTRADGVVMNGVCWVSDNVDFNDGGKQKANVFTSKRCPYVPTITSVGEQRSFDYPELVANITTPTWSGTNPADNYTMSAYTGSNNYAFVATGSSNTRYLQKASLAAGSNVLEFKLSLTDAPGIPTGTATIDPATGNMAVVYPDTTTDTWTFGGDVNELYFNQVVPQYELSGIFNPELRPITTLEHASNNVKDDDLVSDEAASLVGADVAKKVWMFMEKLTQDDVAKGTNQTPIVLGEPSGNIGRLLGSAQNLYVTPALTSGQVYASNGNPDKIGKSSTLHISIPELPVRSYEGGYDGIGKNIAVLPREEFKSQGANGGQLVYVSDFENWIDIQSASDLYLNQFSVEIRNSDGSLATDLLPDTSLQIKIREDPSKIQVNQMKQLVESLQRSGSILSQDLSNVAS